MKMISVLGQRIDKQYLLSKLYEMGFDEESAEDELEYLIDYLYELPDLIELYRIISVDNKKDIDIKKPGSHYSTSKKDLLKSYSFCTGCGDEIYLLTVESPKELIDISQTLANRILYPNEQEITLKNKGSGVNTVSIKKIKR
jgi:hypothetical protein